MNKWIKTEDRFPGPNTPIIYETRGYIKYGLINNAGDMIWGQDGSFLFIEHIQQWMPFEFPDGINEKTYLENRSINKAFEYKWRPKENETGQVFWSLTDND